MKYYEGMKEPWKRFEATEEDWNDGEWQRDNAITTPSRLAEIIRLTDNQVSMIVAAIEGGKPMRITPYYASLMGKNPTSVNEKGESIDSRVNAVFTQAVPTPAHYLFQAGVPDTMAEGSRSFGSAYQRYLTRLTCIVSQTTEITTVWD